MKRIMALAVAFTVFGGLAGFQRASAQTLAVDSYIEQHSQELRQVRRQVDVVARNETGSSQSRFAPVYDALVQAEQALAELRTAPESERPQRRLKLEEAKARALRLWRDFRLTSPAAEPANRG